MTVLRRLAVNLLRQIELGPKKVSLQGRLIMANHDSCFILKALGFSMRLSWRDAFCYVVAFLLS